MQEPAEQTSERSGSWRLSRGRRRTWLVGLGALALIGIAVAAVWWIHPGSATSQDALAQATPSASSLVASVDSFVSSSGIVSATNPVTTSSTVSTTGGSGADADPNKLTKKQFRTYVVREGETLGEIAERFGVSTMTLVWANDLEADPDRLQIGQELLVPPGTGVTHIVVEGDTVATLAAHYEVETMAVIETNDLVDPYIIHKGQKLFVPGGVKSAPSAAIATGGFVWPTYGAITTYFREDGRHAGLDLANSTGTPIVAADGGVVVTAARLIDSYGWHVIIDHLNGYCTVYGHLSRIDVEAGDTVRRGDVIGLMGNTGYSTGPHLHFEVRSEGALVDPLDYLP